MILSIDKLLQLIIEGKDVQKIAELSELDVEQVIAIVEDAKKLLLKYEKVKSKRKIILKKNTKKDAEELEDGLLKRIIKNSEFNAVPFQDNLVIILSIIELDSLYAAGMIIEDSNSNQVGKISFLCNNKNKISAEIDSLKKAIEVGKYFQTKELKIRIDNETLVTYINKDISCDDEFINKAVADFKKNYLNSISCRIEYLNKSLIEKAQFVARKIFDKDNKRNDSKRKN